MRQLEYFIAIAEEQHFTRAAARCHVSQSTISASIAALERELGTQVFVRDARRVAITSAGSTFLTYARRALESIVEGRQAISGSGALRGTLRIGTIQTLGVIDLPQVIARFHRTHPHVQIVLTHDAATALQQATADDQLDLCIVDGAIDERHLVRHPLGTDTLHLIVPVDDPLAERPEIALTDPALADREFLDYRTDSSLTAQIDIACTAADLVRRVSCKTHSIQYLVDGIRHGLGLGILPQAAIATSGYNLIAVPLVPSLTRTISAATTRRHPPNPITSAFLDSV